MDNEARTFHIPAVNVGGLKPPGDPRIPTEEEREAVMARRRAMAEQLRAKAAEEEPEEPAAPAEPREDVESFEIVLPNGYDILYGPPPGVAITMRIANLLGAQSGNNVLFACTQTALCIRKLNGGPPPRVESLIDVQKIMNMIGDDGLEILSAYHQRLWPNLRKEDLPAIKKNVRQS